METNRLMLLFLLITPLMVLAFPMALTVEGLMDVSAEENIVAYWPFDDDFNDYALTNNGTPVNAFINKSSGGFKVGGGALDLTIDNGLAYIRVDDHGSLDITGPITISAWVKFAPFDHERQDGVILIKGTGGGYSTLAYYLGFSNGRLMFLKTNGAGGIVIDLEPYNSRPSISQIADESNKTSDEVMQRLAEIGAEIADITNESYPESVLWFLYFSIDNSVQGLIVKGILDRANEQNYSFRVVEGGETNLWYAYASLDDMKDKLQKQYETFYPEFYPITYPNLALGGGP